MKEHHHDADEQTEQKDTRSNLEQGASEQEHEGPEPGKRSTIKAPDPVLPSKAEVDEHEFTHLPYRS